MLVLNLQYRGSINRVPATYVTTYHCPGTPRHDHHRSAPRSCHECWRGAFFNHNKLHRGRDKVQKCRSHILGGPIWVPRPGPALVCLPKLLPNAEKRLDMSRSTVSAILQILPWKGGQKCRESDCGNRDSKFRCSCSTNDRGFETSSSSRPLRRGGAHSLETSDRKEMWRCDDTCFTDPDIRSAPRSRSYSKQVYHARYGSPKPFHQSALFSPP